jgi:hypothetical protein
MKSLAAVLLVIVLVVVAIPHAFGERAADRPPGVPADNWVPISENLGVVLVAVGPANPEPQPVMTDRQLLMVGGPSSNGYFMVRRGDHWTRLVVAERPGDRW